MGKQRNHRKLDKISYFPKSMLRVHVQYVHVYTFIQAVTACAYKLLCECVHLCEFMCTHESCHGKTLPSPDNAIKALVLHVTFYLLSRETNKLPPYLSQ